MWQTFIAIHVESRVLGAGKDMDMQTHLLVYERLMNDVEIEARYHGVWHWEERERFSSWFLTKKYNLFCLKL